jgi:hypothetical protein
LHPLSEREQVLANGARERGGGGDREANTARLKKILKKFLEGTEKALHLQSVSARKRDRAEGSEVL